MAYHHTSIMATQELVVPKSIPIMSLAALADAWKRRALKAVFVRVAETIERIILNVISEII